MLPYGFATLAELKARLGIDVSETSHDAVLQEILNGVSGAIEASVGRQLRRSHRLVEYFTGGERLIRTRMFPVAAVHSVRESDTRDFETSGSYEELTENATDGFMLDRDTTGREPGASGFIRRLGQKWLGDADSPGMIRVEYTGGYKSEEEVDLENATVTLSGTAVLDYAIAYESTAATYDLVQASAEALSIGSVGLELTTERRGLIRFATASILSVWDILDAVLTIGRRKVIADPPAWLAFYAIQQDPMLRSQLSSLWGSADDDNNSLLTTVGTSADWVATDIDLLPVGVQTGGQAVFQEALKTGFLGIAVIRVADTGELEVATVENTTSSYRPSLEIEHGLAFSDLFTTPDDLRHAALIQSAHDWQTRRHPGMTAQTMRGVAIASGASYMKKPSHLLPEVADIAQRYRQYR